MIDRRVGNRPVEPFGSEIIWISMHVHVYNVSISILFGCSPEWLWLGAVWKSRCDCRRLTLAQRESKFYPQSIR